MSQSSAAPRSATYGQLLTHEAKGKRTRRATVHALEWVLLPHRMNTYGAYEPDTGPTWYLIDDKDRGWWLHYVWYSRLTGGVAKITHKKSAEKRKKSKVTSQRWARKLDRLGLVKKVNMPDENHGGLGPNRYCPLDPSYPDGPQGDALAIVYSGEVRVLTAQPIQIPDLPDTKVSPEKPKPGAPTKTSTPSELPLPSAWGMAIARAAGLYDRLELAMLWSQYLSKRQSGKPMRNAGGYWRRMCENRAKELVAAGVQPHQPQQGVLVIRPRTPDQERHDRRRYMIGQAGVMLSQGVAPQEVMERLADLVYPAGLCVTSGPSQEEIRLAVAAARDVADQLIAERNRHQGHTLSVGADTAAWLRRQYQDLQNRPVTARERGLFGNRMMTPNRAAQIISLFPQLPVELRQASAEQIEKLLESLL